MRVGDFTPEVAPVEPAEESWTRMDVDDGDHDEQDEADQPEELRRVCAARGAISQENSRRRHLSESVLCCQEGCEQVRSNSKMPRMRGPVKHAHNDECRNRIAKLLMDEGAQRVESFFDRARVREETTGRAVSSSGAATGVTDAQTVKRKAEETVDTDAQAKKRQTAVTPVLQGLRQNKE